MKFFILVTVLAQLALAFSEEQLQTKQSRMYFTYKAGAVAAYPPGTTIIYQPGAKVDYIAGASVIYVQQTAISFITPTEVYTQNGPVTYAAGSEAVFQSGTQIAYGPGASVQYAATGETRYEQFNGNTHAIAGYPEETSVQYYYGPNGRNLILFAPGSNPLSFYNPGGSTQFGFSAIPVEKDPESTPSARTFGSYYGGNRGGYSYCSGYSYNGWPQTNYYNYNTGYRSSCRQSCYNCYSYYSNGGGGMGGGGSGGGGMSYGK
jgi:hypothetical protein